MHKVVLSLAAGSALIVWTAFPSFAAPLAQPTGIQAAVHSLRCFRRRFSSSGKDIATAGMVTGGMVPGGIGAGIAGTEVSDGAAELVGTGGTTVASIAKEGRSSAAAMLSAAREARGGRRGHVERGHNRQFDATS